MRFPPVSHYYLEAYIADDILVRNRGLSRRAGDDSSSAAIGADKVESRRRQTPSGGK